LALLYPEVLLCIRVAAITVLSLYHTTLEASEKRESSSLRVLINKKTCLEWLEGLEEWLKWESACLRP
jgi:hypothetical protein